MTQLPQPFGSAGEHQLQQQLGTADRAARFYDRQVRPHLTPEMRDFIGRQAMVFLATADSHGECDASFRAGPPGFVHVIDEHTLAYPEFRGNGVLASTGNMTENPHLGMLFVDFTHHHVGLHVNGVVRLYRDADLRPAYPALPADAAPGRSPQMWVHLTVEEAYIHCSKYIPHLEPAPRPASNETARPRDSDYFTSDGEGPASEGPTRPTSRPERFPPHPPAGVGAGQDRLAGKCPWPPGCRRTSRAGRGAALAYIPRGGCIISSTHGLAQMLAERGIRTSGELHRPGDPTKTTFWDRLTRHP